MALFPVKAQDAQELQEEKPRGLLPAVRFENLSDRTLGVVGRSVLDRNPEAWFHSESDHFVLHYTDPRVAPSVAVEADFYYRVITQDLRFKPRKDSGKNHLFLFSNADDWLSFIGSVKLEVWTGAAKIGQELFVPRVPGGRVKGHALGHEVAHLLVERFLGPHLPLWLNEGYAEDASRRGHAAFYRARGYRAKPKSLPFAGFIPLETLNQMTDYPTELTEVYTFYRQSRRLCAFLNQFGDQQRFINLLSLCAKGEAFEPALVKAYDSRWRSVADLETAFKAELAKP